MLVEDHYVPILLKGDAPYSLARLRGRGEATPLDLQQFAHAVDFTNRVISRLPRRRELSAAASELLRQEVISVRLGLLDRGGDVGAPPR
jgi:hypothetical protein